jgi:hypothetical protein
MERSRIRLVPFEVGRDALLLHEDLGADAAGVGAEFLPAAGLHLHHGSPAS